MTDRGPCGAKKRDGSGETCRLPAGWGTGRAYGPCKLHGGAAAKANLKHGFYSKFTTHRLAAMIDKLAGDESLLDLRKTIALQQVMIIDILNRLGADLDQKTAEVLAGIGDKLGRNIERLHKLEEGEKYILKVEEVQRLVQQVVIIIREEVKDSETVQRVGKRLQGGLRW